MPRPCGVVYLLKLSRFPNTSFRVVCTLRNKSTYLYCITRPPIPMPTAVGMSEKNIPHPWDCQTFGGSSVYKGGPSDANYEAQPYLFRMQQ